MPGLSIGELARRTNVKVPTIRYYEEIRLIPEPMRTEGQQRRYDESAVARLKFIRHARDLGFDVADIREFLELSGHPERPCDRVDRIAERHLTGIDRRIAQLVALRAELNRMLGECHRDTIAQCRVIEVLTDHSQCLTDHVIDTPPRLDGGAAQHS